MTNQIQSAAFPKVALSLGYTLIELLIVIVIISIVSSIAVISIHSNQNKQLETVAQKLTTLFKLAETEAMLRPATLGFALERNNYQFYEFDDSKKSWRLLETPHLKKHQIPNPVQLTLKIQGKIIPASAVPHIIFSSSNEVSPFLILISKKNHTAQYQIIGYANGEIRYSHVDE